MVTTFEEIKLMQKFNSLYREQEELTLGGYIQMFKVSSKETLLEFWRRKRHLSQRAVATINIQIIRTAVTNSGIVAIWMNLKMDEPKERFQCRQAGRNNGQNR